MLLPNATKKLADWLSCCSIHCDRLHILIPWSITDSIYYYYYLLLLWVNKYQYEQISIHCSKE